MLKRLSRLFNDIAGATAVEYGLICALIVIAMIAALSGTANKTVMVWNTVATQVSAH